MTRIYKLPIVALLAGILGISRLNGETPVSPETPEATPAPAESPHSLKKPVVIESPEGSIIIVAPRHGFEVVPGKDPNGWSFILEPYLWAMGMDGTVGVKGFDSHVNFSPLTVVKHLDWGVMAKGEVRKGKWGILGDGFFAQLSADGEPPGPLYDHATLKIQQGMTQLALAYRIIDDRRGFLDIYAGARYNYLGINMGLGLDSSNLNQIATDATDRIVSAVGARVESAVAVEEQKLLTALANEKAILITDARNRVATSLENAVAAEEQKLQGSLANEKTILTADSRNRIAASLESDLAARLKQDLLTGSGSSHELLNKQELLSVTKVVNAALDARLTQDPATNRIIASAVGARAESVLAAEEQKLLTALANEKTILIADARNRIAASLESDLSARLNDDIEKRLKQDLTRSGGGHELLSKQELRRVTRGVRGEYRSFLNAVLDARLAQDEAQLDAAKAQAKAQADARVAAAQKKLTNAINQKLGNALPTSESDSKWWIDPIIGLRGQINLTRWLFLALQGDVGGFEAGSQIAWQASGTVGINITRNLFVETGYRYFYMDYKSGGFLYKAAEAGLFTGIGVKF